MSDIDSVFERIKNQEVWWKSALRWLVSFSILYITARTYVEVTLWLTNNLQMPPVVFFMLAALLFVGLISVMIMGFTFVDRFGRKR